MILGAVLAGGRSTRFGSDKALATIGGRRLIDRTAAALADQVDRVVICGREWPPYCCLPDRPAPGLGPLGGLAAALHFAAANDFEAVLSLPVDTLAVPANLLACLGSGGPRYFDEQYLVGFWPASLAGQLEAHVAAGHRSVRSWLAVCSARSVAEPHTIGNANFAHDLGRFAAATVHGR